jgi:carbonic anhydrase/acetyltransferase-like protein (isoleucine patch superfamily)
LVPAGRRFPARSLLMGSPARVVRTLSDADIERIIRHGHAEYLRLAAQYRAGQP